MKFIAVAKEMFISNIRYLFVFLFLGIFLIFGKNVSTQSYNPDESDLEKYRYFSDNLMRPGQNQLRLQNFFSSAEGDNYRLILGIRAEEETTASDMTSSGVDVDIFITSTRGAKKYLKTVSGNFTRSFVYYEITFETEKRYENILLERKNKEDKSLIIVDDPSITRLERRESISQLQPTIIGNTDISAIDSENTSSSEIVYGFLNSDRLAGEIFRSDSDYISGVELKMHFFGSGGTGLYNLDLHEVAKEGDKFIVQDNILSSFSFDSEKAEYIYQTDKTNSIYQFPLVAKVKAGNYYFIGISSKLVHLNLLNHLRLYGSKKVEDSSEHFAVAVGKGGLTKKIGDFYHRIFGANFTAVKGTNILTGAVIGDFGNGKGVYHYKTTENPIHFLDIDSYSIDKEVEKNISLNQNVYYDFGQNAIISPAFGKNNFVYKINTVYPMTKLFITAEPADGELNGQVFFSFDQENWSTVAFTKDGSPDELLLNKKRNNFYLKLENNQSIQNFKKYGHKEYFGLKNLKITAELEISNAQKENVY